MGKLNVFTIEIEINRSKSDVWDLVFHQFGEVNNFNPLIINSHYESGPLGEVGTERKCEITPGNWVREKISASRGDMDEMDVDIVEGGLPLVAEMKATIQLREVNAFKTIVKMTAKVRTKPALMFPIMKGPMSSKFHDMLIGMKYYAETGALVTKENIKAIKKEYAELNDAFKAPLAAALA
ncbi:MAG: SRPBCC family protein [Flavobacteriales bacterium]|nr:SRPBCC family protein [Flavobacteriales bacterium]